MKLIKVNNKTKLFVVIIIIYYFLFINYNLLKPKEENGYLINESNKYIKVFLNLKRFPENYNNDLILKEKVNILNKISANNLSSIKRIIFGTKGNFGNILISLNKIIFFCEIIKCYEILLDKNTFWFIKNKMFLKELNLTIGPVHKFNISYNDTNKGIDTIYYNSLYIFYYIFKIKPRIRIYLLKEEIMNNLPKLNIFHKDLYIHIRSGDIFSTLIHKPYAQPPLCFYASILKNFEFRNVFLISENKNNPIIDKLTGKFKSIIYKKNKLMYDLSCLLNCYNLVSSISSFLNTIIILNYKLENLFDYNLYQMTQKIYHHHYDLFELNHTFTIYRMEATQNYKKKMYIWKYNKSQRKLMIKEKCINSFMIVKNK